MDKKELALNIQEVKGRLAEVQGRIQQLRRYL